MIITGYHGTDAANLKGIIADGFLESENDTWLGNAVYFFVEGISALDCSADAANWAKDQSYGGYGKPKKYHRYVVLETDIPTDDDLMLDLTVRDGARWFNDFRRKYLEQLRREGKMVQGEVLDSHILNAIREEIGIEFVKGEVYIRFGKDRIDRIHSRIANVTIFAVNNPNKNIPKNNIKVHSKGNIL